MKKRLLSLLSALALLLTLAPAALAAGIPGQIYTAANGDGVTPFNLQWKDTAKGIISFEKQQTGGDYRLTIYRDGKQVGGLTVGNLDTIEQVNIADELTASGTYIFTLHRCSPPNMELSAGAVAQSAPYVYTLPAAQLSAPTNLRFESIGGKVTCVWEVPANWVEGRDLFQVDIENTTTGWGTRSISLPGTRYDVDFKNFIAPQWGGPSTDAGIYTFSVKAISGDIGVIQSAADFTEGTATYSHPDGAIVNPQGTTPTPPPQPAVKTAYMRQQTITIDSTAITFQTYALKDEKGNETNYVKLRDVAAKLNGTSVQFNVGWDGAVNIETGKAYVPNGTEMATPFTGDRPYTDAAAPTNVNGAKSGLAAIVLNDDKGAGYTYYKLRDLGAALGFKVDWSADKGITVDTGATAPVGKIEHPAVTDPTLTAPTGLKLTIGTRTEYGSDGYPKQMPSATPGVTFTNSAGDRAKMWIVRLYDEKNNLRLDTYWSANRNSKDLCYDLGEVRAGTISTITLTPVDPGADGYVSSGAQSDDKVGLTAEFKCKITVTAKTGTSVTISTSPTDWSEEDWNLTLSLTAAPFGYGMMACKYTETYPDGGSGQHTTGRSVSADENGKLEFSEEKERFDTQYAETGSEVTLAMFSDAVVNGTTGSYTVTVHPVTVQK